MRRSLILLTALAGTLAGLGCSRRAADAGPGPAPVPVRLASVGETGAPGWVAATLTAGQHAVLSTRLAASVKRVYVTEGQKVAAGALLVSLADEDLQGGLRAAEAGLAAAEAQSRRIAALLAQNAATAAERDAADTQLAQARAGVAQVRANLAYTQVRAPFAGVVQTRMVDAGAFVAPGAPLVELEGQGAQELQGSVSEAEAKGLKVGQELVFEADGRQGRAQVTGLATGGDPISHRGALRARVLGKDGFRTGAFARLRLPAAAPAAPDDPWVPQSALVRRGELTGVFLARDGQAQLRWLALGDLQGDRVQVRAGLGAGDKVIDRPGDLRDGQPVEVRP